MNIYVGNLSFSATEDDVRQAFESFGQVTSVSIIMDRDSGRSKGFGFVEMAEADAAKSAISALNGQDIKGRPIRVNEALPKNSNNRGGGGRGGRGPRGGGFNGGGGRGARGGDDYGSF